MNEKPESHSSEWETPRWLFDELDAEFHFGLDAACTAENTKCSSGYRHDLNIDALTCCWKDHSCDRSIFLNPPYDRTISQWVRKALMESMRGATVVCILPVRTSTRWWHEYVLRANEIRFLPRRVRFEYRGRPHGSPREDTAVVVFRGIGTQSRPQDKINAFKVED